MQKKIASLCFLAVPVFIASCSSTPKASLAKVSEVQAKEWFNRFCSKGLRAQSGDMILKANTQEFKGLYPANLRFESNGAFVLEVTNILGGTMLRLTSDGKEMAAEVPPKPKFNRKHISHYLGLDVSILSELLLGDLPCPETWKSGGVRVDGNHMQIVTSNWKWIFEKSDDATEGVPVRVLLEPKGVADPNLTITLAIEEWDSGARYAKKVSVKGPEGELRWTWRNRN
jgi:hypothetical protein